MFGRWSPFEDFHDPGPRISIMEVPVGTAQNHDQKYKITSTAPSEIPIDHTFYNSKDEARSTAVEWMRKIPKSVLLRVRESN